MKMNKKGFHEGRRHFTAFLTALVMAFTLLPMEALASSLDVGGSGELVIEGSCEHDWGDWKVTKEATCTEPGEETRVCSNNSEHTETREIAIDDTAHAWGEWQITTAATCSAPGMETWVCSHNSEHTESRETAIDDTAHALGESRSLKLSSNLLTTGTNPIGERETMPLAMASYPPENDDHGFPCGIMRKGKNWQTNAPLSVKRSGVSSCLDRRGFVR